MRLDDLPKSGNIEDRRGGMSGLPGGARNYARARFSYSLYAIHLSASSSAR
jgi:hypothetical protein